MNRYVQTRVASVLASSRELKICNEKHISVRIWAALALGY